MDKDTECKKGNHLLEPILVSHDLIYEKVARWCSWCGAIIIDIDYDNRTDPGAIMKIKLPGRLYKK